jgi:hypothetical protein
MRHLSTENLIELVEGRTSPQNNSHVEHLETCGSCAAEAGEWLSLLDLMTVSVLESAPPHALRNCFAIYQVSKPVSRLRQLFATVLFDSTLAPAPVGIRGVSQSQQLVFRAADLDVHVRISGNPRVILGQIMRRQPVDFVVGAPVALSQGDQQIEATITDTLGEFRFEIVPVGKLQVHVQLPSYCVINDLTIKEEEIQL